MKRALSTMLARLARAPLLDAACVIHIVIAISYIAGAVVDWHARVTWTFIEKGPPPVRLWDHLYITSPARANSLVIVLAAIAAACATRCLLCDRVNRSLICAHGGHPAIATPPCPECGRDRPMLATGTARRRWAWCSAVSLLMVTWAVGLTDLLDLAFGWIHWLLAHEYLPGSYALWPLGLKLEPMQAAAIWIAATFLAVTECVLLLSTTRRAPIAEAVP